MEKKGWAVMQWDRGYSLLHWAAKNDRPDLCKYFLALSADPAARDGTGRTALEYARDENSAGAIAALLPLEHPSSPHRRPRDVQRTLPSSGSSGLLDARAAAALQSSGSSGLLDT